MKLSVAVCTYNGAKYIEEELLSIVNQRVAVDEIVICDDDSTDGTLDVVKNFVSSYEGRKIAWRICENTVRLGVTKNFEKAIRLCTGDLIFLADQDDVWFDDKTEVIVDYFLHNKHTEVVFSDSALIDGYGMLLTDYTLFDAIGMSFMKGMWKAGMGIEIFNVTSNKVTGCTLALKKTFCGSLFPFDENLLHDYQIAIKAVSQGVIDCVDKSLMKYRLHENNVVGLRNSWIFNKKAFDERGFLSILEPVPARTIFYQYVNGEDNRLLKERLDFLNLRSRCIQSWVGRIRLLLQIPAYIRLYRKYSFYILVHDILYGKISYTKFMLPTL